MAYKNVENPDDNYKDITIEDVEVAVMILERWNKLQQRVQQVTSRINPPTQNGQNSQNMGLDINQVISKVIEARKGETQQASGKIPAEISTGDFAPEQIQEMKDLTTKFKAKNAKPAGGSTAVPVEKQPEPTST